MFVVQGWKSGGLWCLIDELLLVCFDALAWLGGGVHGALDLRIPGNFHFGALAYIHLREVLCAWCCLAYK